MTTAEVHLFKSSIIQKVFEFQSKSFFEFGVINWKLGPIVLVTEMLGVGVFYFARHHIVNSTSLIIYVQCRIGANIVEFLVVYFIF